MSSDGLAREHRFRTAGGIEVMRRTARVPLEPDPVAALGARLDDRRGVLLASSYEYPGRYTRWDIGFANPPIEIVAWGRAGVVRALNGRGAVLLDPIRAALEGEPHVARIGCRNATVEFTVREPEPGFTEEDRSRQPTVFSALRAITARFAAEDDAYLGLYGAFGYDLAFQFDPIRRKWPRAGGGARMTGAGGGHRGPGAAAADGGSGREGEDGPGGAGRDLVLYLPDAILVVDHQAATAEEHCFDFAAEGRTTAGLPRTGPCRPPWQAATTTVARHADHRPGEYADCVRAATRALPARRSLRGGARPVVLRALRRFPVGGVPAASHPQPRALRGAHEPGGTRIPRRRLARNVRAGGRPAHRDLPHLRYRGARRGCHRRTPRRS